MKSYERWNSYPDLNLCLSPALTILKKGFEGSGINQQALNQFEIDYYAKRVVIFDAASLVEVSIAFMLDIIQFYELASGWKEEAILAGADIIIPSVNFF
jgi:hypothetical protein